MQSGVPRRGGRRQIDTGRLQSRHRPLTPLRAHGAGEGRAGGVAAMPNDRRLGVVFIAMMRPFPWAQVVSAVPPGLSCLSI